MVFQSKRNSSEVPGAPAVPSSRLPEVHTHLAHLPIPLLLKWQGAVSHGILLANNHRLTEVKRDFFSQTKPMEI
jgi:hypothetical protein